jgi:hypothetical protein
VTTDDITLGGISTGASAIESFPSSPIATLIAERDAAISRAERAETELEVFWRSADQADKQPPGQWRPFEPDRDACTLAGIYSIGLR